MQGGANPGSVFSHSTVRTLPASSDVAVAWLTDYRHNVPTLVGDPDAIVDLDPLAADWILFGAKGRMMGFRHDLEGQITRISPVLTRLSAGIWCAGRRIATLETDHRLGPIGGDACTLKSRFLVEPATARARELFVRAAKRRREAIEGQMDRLVGALGRVAASPCTMQVDLSRFVPMAEASRGQLE